MRGLLSKVINWYFTKQALPYWCILFLDSAIVFFSGLFSYYLFHHAMQPVEDFSRLLPTLLIYVFVSVIFFRVFHTYSDTIRYSSFVDLKRVLYACGLSLITALVIHYPLYLLPKSAFVALNSRQIVTMFIIATFFMWIERVLAKSVYEGISASSTSKVTLIYGINDGEDAGLAKNIRTSKAGEFDIKGFISPQAAHRHARLMGMNVYPVGGSLRDTIKEMGIQAVLVASNSVEEFQHDEKLQDLLIDTGVKIYMVEGAKEWNAGEPSPMSLKEVNVEDLLPRDEINIDIASVGKALTGKRILITGAAGSIGSELVRQVAQLHPSALLLIDQAETPEHDVRLEMLRNYPDTKAETVVTDICHRKRMEYMFSHFHPDYVFHAAAYKHVPMMEDNPSEAVLNNVLGTKIIADLSVKYGVKKFVMVSTDKAVNPTNVMGCSKRICEIYCQSLNNSPTNTGHTQFVTTRFGNVLGSNGSVIPLFKKEIAEGGPVTVTDPEIVRFFMLIPEACKLVLEAGVKGNGGEIFVFDMGSPVKIVDLAKRMIALSGAKSVKIAFTGLRKGEKLYEEVLSNEENTVSSFHSKIRIAKVREYDFGEISNAVDSLIEIASHYDDMATVKKMKDIVPEYISRNSVYEVLDKKS